MTNPIIDSPEFSALAGFFEDTDIEALRVKALESYDLDILGVYCLHTGRQVGSFDTSVIQFAIDEESSDDDEALIDGLVSRVIASMRPSPMLNRPDRITLRNLAEKHPVDVLSYLVNRLHSNRYLAVNRGSEVLAPYIARIATHKQWTWLASKGVDTRPWIHWLLELDAKRNLHELSPPVVKVGIIGDTFPRELFSQINENNHVELLALFEKWAFARLAEFEKRDREATAQANWMRGNTMSQPAFVRSWMENPEVAGRKRNDELKRLKNKPLRPRTEKQQKQDARLAIASKLLDQVLEGALVVSQAKPQPKVLTAGMLFAKKESQS